MAELENKIEDFVLKFNEQNIKIEFRDFLKGKVRFNNIEYDKNRGFLRFLKGDDFIEFSITDINKFEYIDEKVEIKLDNSIDIVVTEK